MSEEAVKIAVLEQKLSDFSNVVHKLDDAIEKLSEVNSNVIKMLAVHEEKIEQCNRSDDLIIKMIDEVKSDNDKDHKKVMERIEDIEEKVQEINKIKWMTVGCGVLLVVLTGALSSLASGWWTPSEMQQHHQLSRQARN
jgi:tetrahydromethanopterin S-methyltransferase subunit G